MIRRSEAISSGMLTGQSILSAMLGLLATRNLLDGWGSNTFGTYAAAISSGTIAALLAESLSAASIRLLAGHRQNPHLWQRSVDQTRSVHRKLAAFLLIFSNAIAVLIHQFAIDLHGPVRTPALLAAACAATATSARCHLAWMHNALQSQQRFGWLATSGLCTAAIAWCSSLQVASGTLGLSEYAAINAFGGTACFGFLGIHGARKCLTFGSKRDTAAESDLTDLKYYWKWGAIASLGSMYRTQGIVVLANMAGGGTGSAAAAIAFQLQSITRQVIAAINQASAPRLYATISGDSPTSRLHEALGVCSFSFRIALTAAIAFFFTSDVILTLWGNQIPAETALACNLLLAALCVEASTMSIGPALTQAGLFSYFVKTMTVTASAFPIAGLLAVKMQYGITTLLALLIASNLSLTLVRIYYARNLASDAWRSWILEVAKPAATSVGIMLVIGIALRFPPFPGAAFGQVGRVTAMAIAGFLVVTYPLLRTTDAE